MNAPLAAFYRTEPGRRVVPAELSARHGRSAEECVRGEPGWLIAPVAEFLGNEGRVQGRTWLFFGDERHPYSVAAWRALRPGESPAAVLYRDRTAGPTGAARRELLVRTWDGSAARLRVTNPTSAQVSVLVMTSAGRAEATLAPGQGVGYEVPATPSGLVPVTITSVAAAALRIELLP